MEERNEGAWLLSHAKKLDGATGVHRFEKIHYAGRIGRLLNILRRETSGKFTVSVSSEIVTSLCQLNNIDLPTRREGLRVLQDLGLVDVSQSGGVDVLGATTETVLKSTSQIFQSLNPTGGETGIVEVSEKISASPQAEELIIEQISDEQRLTKKDAANLIAVANDASLIDREEYKGSKILFSQNVFRSANKARKIYLLLQSRSTLEQNLINEAVEKVRAKGAVHEEEVKKILGVDLLRTLISLGFFDRMEVNNEAEAAGYLACPDAFQRFGSSFQEDPVDDAKALLASLTYGMSRSSYARGQITLPTKLLNKLVEGGEVGDDRPVRAIGEDYREVERRGVIQVIPHGRDRFSMKLLKRDVGELARAIIKGQSAAEEALLMSFKPANQFTSPEENRIKVRKNKTVSDQKFVNDALDAIRSGF